MGEGRSGKGMGVQWGKLCVNNKMIKIGYTM